MVHYLSMASFQIGFDMGRYKYYIKPTFGLRFYLLLVLSSSGQSRVSSSEFELDQFSEHEYGSRWSYEYIIVIVYDRHTDDSLS